jgi:3-oxoadipate enol-lactonase
MASGTFASARDGTKIRYWTRGRGDPLALIMGFGGSGRGWGEPFLKNLEARFKLFVIDNRGTGESDKPDNPIKLTDMAADIAAVLDHADVRRAHIVGISMGGMIAQEFALNFADRTRRLVLGCTNCGQSHSVAAPMEVVAKLMPNPALSLREQAMEAMTVACGRRFRESAAGMAFIEQMLDEQGKYPLTPPHTATRQMQAIGQFDSFDRLPQIKLSTLVISGDDDTLIPVRNAEILHERIGGSKVKVLPGIGHLFPWEAPNESASAVVDHLSAA